MKKFACIIQKSYNDAKDLAQNKCGMKLQSKCTMKKPIFINNNKNVIQMNEGVSRNNELPFEDDVEAKKNLDQDNMDLDDISRAFNLEFR